MGWQLHLKLKSFLTGSLIQNRTLLTYALHTENDTSKLFYRLPRS